MYLLSLFARDIQVQFGVCVLHIKPFSLYLSSTSSTPRVRADSLFSYAVLQYDLLDSETDLQRVR